MTQKKARGVLDIRKSFPAKNKVAAKTARIEKNFPTQKPPKTEATATRFGATNAKVYFIRSEARL